MKNLLLSLFLFSTSLFAQDKESDILSEATFTGLKFRNIGPAFTSGRIADIAIHPENRNTWYVAVGSGGVWKTENSGVTWTPVFDSQTVYSTGCISIDPGNPGTIWLGTGEDVGGRHVGIGDGVYKSTDEGMSWKNMGLKSSEHIARIIIHPENSDIVYVAAQGPLWSKGGERGLYKTTDGGKNWKKLLGDDEWTGVTDMVADPRNPDLIYAATWQRQRTVAAYMGGGPGSGIHRSTDGGESWEKLTSGIPASNLGKIGLAVSPQNPDVIYAAIELDRRTGGIFMSTNRGASWVKQSNTVSEGTGPHYYQELYASPHAEGRLYLMDVRTQVSDDHGKTFRPLKEERKHSDNHSLAFLMDDPNYLLIGTDGGIYESHDLAENWRFVANLPVTQYYKLAVDDREPFYFIYGGTQDNGTHGGPSRTDNRAGIRNSDWTEILGADGHQPATEPGNPNIVYGEYQQGVLHRVDRITGEQLLIQPQPGAGEGPERFNWDSPILVSPHDPARLYFASHRIWRSDNRGDSWTSISGDLTRNQERMELPIMGKKQSWDNPWDVYAMSEYNSITSLAESPIQEGLIYAGTDDGIIQITEDGGRSWGKTEISGIREIPATAFVNNILADLYDARTVYVALDNHKYGDYKPYIIKSTDAGSSWISLSGDLPEKLMVWRLAQDHVRKDLLFAATEFGIYFTPDGGDKWIKLKGGIPTIAFRDLTIQRRENDLVCASFGRGFFILDDYSPLREVSTEMLSKEVLFEVKDALWYTPRSVFDAGASRYDAENPPFGAIFTYFLPGDITDLKSERQKKEKKLIKENQDIPFPGWDKLDAEKQQASPEIRLLVKDAEGNLINVVKGKTEKGYHRVSWNLRYSSKMGVRLDTGTTTGASSDRPSGGPMAAPGTYSVSLVKLIDGNMTELSETRSFEVKPLHNSALKGSSSEEILDFKKEMDKVLQDYTATYFELEKSLKRVKAMNQAALSADRTSKELQMKIHQAGQQLMDLEVGMKGSPSVLEVGEVPVPTLGSRLSIASSGLRTSYGPTKTHKESLEIAKSELALLKINLSTVLEQVFPQLEKELKDAGAPWIEGQGLIRE